MYRFETQVIHAGWDQEPLTGAVNVPLYLSSTFVQSAPGEHKGYDYSRAQNPTREVFEKAMAELEHGAFAIATNSGCSAQLLLAHLLAPGDHVLCFDDVYGGTWRQWELVLKPSMGIEVDFVDFRSSHWLEKVKPQTRLIWIETPSNPLLKVVDVPAVVQAVKPYSLQIVVDNTFATPMLQQPLTWGVHWVVHSTTKYISGHSDLIGGVVIGKDPSQEKRLRFLATSLGVTMGVMDAYWHWRSLKTLAVRVKAAQENAQKVAQFLAQHPQVEKVYYPGLPGPDELLVKRLMKGPGAMVSFRFKGDWSYVRRFLTSLRVFKLAESLGAVESLANHPATMTHASVPQERRLARGIDDQLIRLSVGIEHADDLIADLDQAFKAAR